MLGLGLFSALLGPAQTRSPMFDRLQRRNNSHGQSIFPVRIRPQQQTQLPPLLLSIDGTDRLTDGRTLDRFMTLTTYYADRAEA